MRVILDTNFVLTCVKEKIDFILVSEEVFSEKFDFFIPEEVLEELAKISKRKGEKTKDKEAAKLSLKIIESLEKKGEVNRIKVGEKDVDKGIVNYIKESYPEKFLLATMDKALKKKAGTGILTVRGKKGLEIV
jgi:rRNA-processing protein FCF1